jgi:putative MATE family efflux protein
LPNTGSISRQLFRLAAPIIGINVLAVLMLAVDSALCGRMENSEPVLSALGYAVQVVFLLMTAMLGLMVGTVALVARAYGGKQIDRVNELLIQATQLTLIVGVVVAILGAVFAEAVLRVLGAEPTIAAIGAEYLRPLMLGTPFFYLGLLYAGILRGVGNTRIPFWCAVGANIVNAVLNYGLVLGNLGMPALGVSGSAIGTVVAQFLNVVTLVIVLRRGAVPGLKLPLKWAAIDNKLATDMFRIGWPAALDMLVLNAGFLTVIGMLGYLDSTLVAAHGLGLRVQALAFVPGLGIAQATGAMVGQALGAGDIARAREVTRASMILCASIMWALALVIVLAAHPLAAIFDVKEGTPLEEHAVEWMRLLGLAMLPAAVNIALVGMLQGAGATRTSLRINIWTTLLIQIPLAGFLGFGLGLEELGIWLSFPLSFVAKAAGTFLAYKSEKWAVTGVGLRR